jgi:glycosyltransferase involved in cell wall biosynthesis
MRVLHVITEINRGGAENHLFELVKGQLGRGLDVLVAHLKRDDYWAVPLRGLGARVEPLGLIRYGDLGPIARLRRLIKVWQPHVVHAHLPPGELYARLALLGSGSIPFIISKHNDEPFYRGLGHLALGRWVARRAACVIAISDAVRSYVGPQLSIPFARLAVVHYGIDPGPYAAVDGETRSAIRAGWGIQPEELVIGTVARLFPQKAVHVLLHAYATYRKRGRRPARLVIVGRGPLEQELKSIAAKLNIGADIVWVGFREDVPAVMMAFDTFVLTSSYEGFGLVLLEAMAAARPVIATAVSAIPEIVQDNVTGLLCPPGDHARIGAAMIQLEDPDERARLGSAGKVRAIEQFSLERMVASTISLYQSCVGEEGVDRPDRQLLDSGPRSVADQVAVGERRISH